jgi:hypothetical protein
MKKLIALAAAVLMLAPSVARGVDVFVYAEDFTSSYNIMPENIRGEGGALLGLDYAGEWAEFQVSAATFGTYTVTLRCWGNANRPYHFHLVTMPVRGEDPQTIEISYTGLGYCGQ